MNVALFDLDLGPHRLQPLDVLVDRAGTDGAAAGQGNPGFAATGDERTEDEDRRTHGLDHLVGSHRVIQAIAIEHQAVGAIHRNANAHIAEQTQHGRDVVEMRHIGQVQRIGGEQRGAKNRQRGVLGTRHGNFAGKGITPLNQQLIHAGRSILPV